MYVQVQCNILDYNLSHTVVTVIIFEYIGMYTTFLIIITKTRARSSKSLSSVRRRRHRYHAIVETAIAAAKKNKTELVIRYHVLTYCIRHTTNN